MKETGRYISSIAGPIPASTYIKFDGFLLPDLRILCIVREQTVLICAFYEHKSVHGTGILFVIRGDTFNKVWKCILWNIHIWQSVAGCHGYTGVMYDFPRHCNTVAILLATVTVIAFSLRDIIKNAARICSLYNGVQRTRFAFFLTCKFN